MRGKAQERRKAVSLLLTVLSLTAPLANAQLSAPVASDGHVSIDENKFLQNTAELDTGGAR